MLQLLTKPLSLLYEIGFNDYRSRFHFEAFSIQQTSSERIRPVRSKTFVYTKELSFTLNIIDKN